MSSHLFISLRVGVDSGQVDGSFKVGLPIDSLNRNATVGVDISGKIISCFTTESNGPYSNIQMTQRKTSLKNI